MTAAITKIGARTLIVAGVFALVVAANHLRGIEPGTTFATQGIDLKVDSKTWYNGSLVPSSTWALKDFTPGVDKFWQFDDVKPGDFGCTVISLHVKKTDAYMCLDFKNLSESENGENEPESHEDTTSGPDLADGTQFFGWDDIDGDGKYEPPTEKILWGATPASQSLDDTTYVIGDSRGGGICQVDKTRYVGICWCAGALTPQSGMNKSSGSAVCDPTTLGNEAQTDSFTVDVALRAAPVKQNPRFLCDPDEPPPPPDTPSDKECKAYGYDRAVAKYEWEGAWVAEIDPPFPLPGYAFSVTGAPQSVSWTAIPAIAGVIAKSGGPGGGSTAKFPGGAMGTIKAWVPVKNAPANRHDISHITFCAKDATCTTCGQGPTRIDLSNSGSIVSTTTANANTGGNTAGSGGTTNTGNANASASTTNILNRILLRLR